MMVYAPIYNDITVSFCSCTNVLHIVALVAHVSIQRNQCKVST